MEEYQERFKKELIKMMVGAEKLGEKSNPKIKAGLMEMFEKNSKAPARPPEKKEVSHEIVSDDAKRGSW